MPALLQPLERGVDCGLLSGPAPAVADPGANLVRCGMPRIRVVPLVGPSALLLALSLGMNGQRFAFTVTCRSTGARVAAVARPGTRIGATGSAQMFIETPYRTTRSSAQSSKLWGRHSHLCRERPHGDHRIHRHASGFAMEARASAPRAQTDGVSALP